MEKTEWIVCYPWLKNSDDSVQGDLESKSFKSSYEAHQHIRKLKEAYALFNQPVPNDDAFKIIYRGTTPSWETTFNSNMVSVGRYDMSDFSNFIDERTLYPFYSWNGRVYQTADSGAEAICLIEEMK